MAANWQEVMPRAGDLSSLFSGTWMMLTWAENAMAASLVGDQRTRCRSSQQSPLMRLVTPFT